MILFKGVFEVLQTRSVTIESSNEGDLKKGKDMDSETQKTDPEMLNKIALLRSHVRESFGKVVMALMGLPRYRHQSLGDLQHLVLDPLIRDRIAMAYRNSDDQPELPDVAGLAIWASVSEEVDVKIREQIKSGAWPIRLKSEDWNSGKINWLLDVIAQDSKAVAAVLANFKQVIRDGDLRLHPVITRLVDKETLEKMGAKQQVEETT